MAASRPRGRRRPVPLLVSAEWAEAHCRIPDMFQAGQPFVMPDEQLTFWCNHYMVKPTAVWRPDNPMRATAFVHRRSQLIRPQKWGKSPLVAAMICNEAVGPALFAGWARGGELHRCVDNGCDCGWEYEYEPGEPMGMRWPTPLIQITASTEDQTGNTYDALRPMIQLGPLDDLMPKTGEEFIRTPGWLDVRTGNRYPAGYIDTVTSSKKGRLGQRITFRPGDETSLWTESNGLLDVHTTQLRGLGGMGGRDVETTNMYDPSEKSVAQRTHQSRRPDVNSDYRKPPDGLDFEVKAERRKMFVFLYAGAPWVDIDNIEAVAAELEEEKGSGDAERFFGNRPTSGTATYIKKTMWDSRKVTRRRIVAPRTKIVLGFDGSDLDDWTALRAETLTGYQFTPRYGSLQLPTRWNPADWPDGLVPRLDVDAAVREMFEVYDVALMYADPYYWQTEIDTWAAELGNGSTTVRRWSTTRVVQMYEALERLATDVRKPGGGFSHDGDETTSEHVANARRSARPGGRYVIVKASDDQKIDDCMASVICHEAAGDAIADGANQPEQEQSWGMAFA